MSYPRVAWQNVLAACTIEIGNAVSSDAQADLSTPKSNLYHPWHESKPFRFTSQSIVITDVNCKVFWEEAGVLKTVTLAGTTASPKQFRPYNMAMHIENRMNAYGGARRFTVTYTPLNSKSTIPGFYTITVTTGAAVTWVFSNATNTYANAVWASLGIDSADGAYSALSVATSTVLHSSGVKTTGERFILESMALRVQVGAGAITTVSFTDGCYSAKSLAGVITSRVCDVMNITKFTAQFDDSAGKFKFRNEEASDIGIYDDGSDALSTLAPWLGIDSALTVPSSGAVVEADYVARHNYLDILFDAGDGMVFADVANFVFAMWANLSAQATVDLYLDDSNLASASTLGTWHTSAAEHVLLTNPKAIDPEDTGSPWLCGDDTDLFTDVIEDWNYRYMNIRISDPTLDPEKAVEIYGTFAGPFETIECHLKYADEVYDIEDNSETVMGDARNSAINIKPKGDSISCTIPEVDGTGKNTIERLRAYVRTKGLPFLWMEELDIDVVSEFQKTKWMVLATDLSLTEIEPTGNKFTTNKFTLVEGG